MAVGDKYTIKDELFTVPLVLVAVTYNVHGDVAVIDENVSGCLVVVLTMIPELISLMV